jgi:dimethylamine--corrinoid protein Co-methyltransferase
MATIFSRLGDGSPIEMTESELKRDLEEGTADAADRGKIPPLPEEELDHLFDIFASPMRFVSVDRGKEVVLSYDATTLKIRRVGIAVDRIQAVQIYESADLLRRDAEPGDVQPAGWSVSESRRVAAGGQDRRG